MADESLFGGRYAELPDLHYRLLIVRLITAGLFGKSMIRHNKDLTAIVADYLKLDRYAFVERAYQLVFPAPHPWSEDPHLNFDLVDEQTLDEIGVETDSGTFRVHLPTSIRFAKCPTLTYERPIMLYHDLERVYCCSHNRRNQSTSSSLWWRHGSRVEGHMSLRPRRENNWAWIDRSTDDAKQVCDPLTKVPTICASPPSNTFEFTAPTDHQLAAAALYPTTVYQLRDAINPSPLVTQQVRSRTQVPASSVNKPSSENIVFDHHLLGRVPYKDLPPKMVYEYTEEQCVDE